MKRMIALAALVLGAVVLFVMGAALGGGPVDVTAAGARYTVAVHVARPAVGRVPVEVRVTAGDADAVAVSAVMPDMGHSTPEVTAAEREPGLFVAEGELFTMTGVWDLALRLSGPAGEETLVTKVQITEED
jgi:hypothetical protein